MSSLSLNSNLHVNSADAFRNVSEANSLGSGAEGFASSMNDLMSQMNSQMRTLDEVYAIESAQGGGTAFIAPSGGVLSPRNNQSFADILNTELGSDGQVMSKSSLEDRFSVLNHKYNPEEWKVLNGQGEQTQESDFSILETLGDGLMTALKFAANAYIGKVI